MLIRITLLYLLTLSFSSFSQTPEENLKKYWFYRDRLKSDFMVMGEGPGKSIIANQRGFYNQPVLFFGDATINCGWHLAVLATEHALLKKNGQPTKNTEEEIYYTLKAINRLDKSAETCFKDEDGKPGCEALNGFFIRDDVPGDFLSDTSVFRHLNKKKYSSFQITQAQSDFSSSNPFSKEMSHDQVWHMLMGLALISELVDDTVTFKEYNLVGEARTITSRLISYMQSSDWKIFNPVTKSPVMRGRNASLLKRGALFVSSKINRDKSQINNDGKFLWSMFRRMPYCPMTIFHKNACKEYSKLLMLAAIGNSWNGSNTSTLKRIIHLSFPQSYEHYLLLYLVLQQEKYDLEKYDKKYTGLLDEAPFKGPYNFGYPASSSSYEWSSDQRFIHPERRGPYVKRYSFFPGEYNGLDYMLLFNLYCLTKEGNYLKNYAKEVSPSLE